MTSTNPNNCCDNYSHNQQQQRQNHPQIDIGGYNDQSEFTQRTVEQTMIINKPWQQDSNNCRNQPHQVNPNFHQPQNMLPNGNQYMIIEQNQHEKPIPYQHIHDMNNNNSSTILSGQEIIMNPLIQSNTDFVCFLYIGINL